MNQISLENDAVKQELSVVSPVYNSENIVEELVKRLEVELGKLTKKYEIILVDDNSQDGSWNQIKKIAEKNSKVKGIRLSRNFGQHRAISAGLKFAKGRWIIVMDCDLQDRPEEIPRLYEKAQEGFEVVFARRTKRKDSFIRLFYSDMFHKIFSYFVGIGTNRSLANFGIYNQRVIKEYNKLKDLDRAFPMLVFYLGFRQTAIEVEHSERYEGKSSYNFIKLLNTAIDITIANSNRPLYLSVKVGFIIAITSFCIALYNLVAYYNNLIGVPGFTTTVFSIWFTTGILMVNVGVIGIYLGKVYEQTRDRPLFVVQENVNIE